MIRLSSSASSFYHTASSAKAASPSLKRCHFVDSRKQKSLTRCFFTFTSPDEQEEEEEQQQNPYKSKSEPYRTLLHHPSKALWRSNPQGTQTPPPHLQSTQFIILQQIDRTNKQFKRTYERIVNTHHHLAEVREKERRKEANAYYYSKYGGGGGANVVDPDAMSITTATTTTEGTGIEGGGGGGVKPVYYNTEQAGANLRYRLGTNYAIAQRVYRETQSLLGKENVNPRRILDVGCGIGSASAAILDLVLSAQHQQQQPQDGGVDWIHLIDPSKSMRDAAELVLQSVIDNNGLVIRKTEIDKEEDEEEKKMKKHKKRKRGAKTRITTGESLTSTSSSSSSPNTHGIILKNKSHTPSGTFDLVLCTYTLSEIPSVKANQTLATLLWEKLNHNGIAIFIEPGTPDGFSSLRNVRSMLLDCCPPPERRRGKEEKKKKGEVVREECHVIAPCTHNGVCPMERHRRDHLFKKFAAKNKVKSEEEEGGSQKEVMGEYEEENGDVNLEDAWISDSLLMNDDGEGIEEDDEDIEFDDEDEDDGEWWDDEETTTNNKQENDKNDKVRHAKTTEAFNEAYCSFVHALPGGRGGKGEKFSYLVVQKRIRSQHQEKEAGEEDDDDDKLDEMTNPFYDVDLVGMLSETIEAAEGNDKQQQQQQQQIEVRMKDEKKYKRIISDPTKHGELLQKAMEVEDLYVQSDKDELGLELVRGDKARKKWGRIVRAPIKRRGHVLLDYCTAGGEVGESSNDEENVATIEHNGEIWDEEEEEEALERTKRENNELNGRIVRHGISRGWSARVAPGMFSAARKARWGGLWPDVNKRSKDVK